jgi:hypothetical protein
MGRASLSLSSGSLLQLVTFLYSRPLCLTARQTKMIQNDSSSKLFTVSKMLGTASVALADILGTGATASAALAAMSGAGTCIGQSKKRHISNLIPCR